MSASTSQLPPEEPRRSIRPSWSCIACTKKKIKCDKIVPCGQCVRRGKRSECRLQEQHPDLPPREPILNPHREPKPASEVEMEALRESVAAVRQRLFHIEGTIASFVPTFGTTGEKVWTHVSGEEAGTTGKGEDLAVGGVDTGYGSPSERLALPAPVVRLADADDDIEAAINLELLTLGKDSEEVNRSRAEVRRPEDDDEANFPSNSTAVTEYPSHYSYTHPSIFPIASEPAPSPAGSLGSTLPSKAFSDKVIAFSLENTLWQHAAVHPASFLAEVNEFFSWQDDRGHLVNQAWLALYFALLCCGIKHMSPSDARNCGCTPEQLRELPEEYYDSAVAALYRGNFLAKPSVFAVQAIVVLNTCMDIGGYDFSATLLASAIRIAQHLNLHKITSDTTWEETRRSNALDPISPSAIKSLVGREIGKRLWTALATDDWMGTAHRRPYAIFPLHFSTPVPANCHDSDLTTGHGLVFRSLDEPTVVTKLLFSIRIAGCIRQFFDDVARTGSMSSDQCRQVDADIRTILRTAPAFLQPHAPISHLPPFVGWLRLYSLLSAEHKLIVIHRTFIARAPKGSPEFLYSQKAMSQAATNTLSLFVSAPQDFQQAWSISYHVTVAATALILEIFQTSSPSTDASRALVHRALDRLRTMDPASPVAIRGVQLLSTLLTGDPSAASSSAAGPRAKRPRPPSAEGSNKRTGGGVGGPVPAFEGGFSGGMGGGGEGADVTADAFDWLLANPASGEWTGAEGSGNGVGVQDSAGVDFWASLGV